MLRDEFKQLSAIFAVFFCCVTAGAYDFKVGDFFVFPQGNYMYSEIMFGRITGDNLIISISFKST